MKTLSIRIENKIAIREDDIEIVCGNSDYSINFAFDSEWSGYTGKTARFVFVRNEKVEHIDKPFSGNVCNVPILKDITNVWVGVFAGNLSTTTGAEIKCKKSILCVGGTPEPPTEDVYAEIMALFNATYIDPSLTVVDQKYNSKSANPQSGIAVAEAVEQALAEFTPPEDEEQTSEINEIIDPIFIEGAVVENYYNPIFADKQDGIFIDYLGKAQTNSDYCVIKARLFSGEKNTYRLNAIAYSAAIYENDNINGVVKHNWLIGEAQKIEIPETIKDKIVTVFFCFKNTSYPANLIIVEGEDLPTGGELYRITYPWLYIPEEEKEEESTTLSPYTVNEIALKQKMPPHLFDGIEMDNYFDVEYMIANSTQDTQYTKYYHTPFIYLPAGTYTINKCYKYTPMSKDGVKGQEVASGGTSNSATFTITEDNPYISFMIYAVGVDPNTYAQIVGVEALRGISIQKGETATAYIPNTYRFSDKFNFKGSVGYYPTHWDSKKYVAIGDSITFGYSPNGNSEGLAVGQQVSTYYSKVVSENLNMKLLNVGQSGANVKSALGLQSTYKNQVQQAIDFNADIVTIMLGVNDSGASNSAQYVPLGTIDDVYDENNITFYSGLGEIVKRIQTALPSSTIILLSSPKNNFTVNEIKQNYFKAVKDVAEKYDVLFCDLHNGCGFNINNPVCVSEFVLNDVHPDVKAHKILGKRLTGFISSH